MNHEEIRKRLNDYVDGALPPEEVTRVEVHLAECDACRHEVDQLRSIVDCASGLPLSVEPERDLWPGVATKLAGCERGPRPAWFEGLLRTLGGRPVFWPAAGVVTAALVLVLVVLTGRGPQGPTPPPTRVGEMVEEEITEPAADAVIHALEAECREGDLEMARFTSEEGWEARIPVLGLIVENIRIVDRSISELRDAWRSNPDSPRFARMLAAAYRAKVVLQGRASRVAAET